MRRAAPLAALLFSLTLAAPATAAVSLAQVGTFTRPVYVAAPPGDTSRLFVVQQTGQVIAVRDGAKTTVLDLAAAGLVSDVSATPDANERGLLSMAFAADYATTGRFFVYYTARSSGALRIDELRAAGDVADLATRRTVLSIPHSRANHNGGQLQVGPDGMLWIATGDGGGAGDPDGNGQRLSGDPGNDGANPLLAKILRVDPGGSPPYAIPPGQPDFGGQPHAPEIWSYGLRNPFRFSFDRQTGDLVIGDVGQGAYEEIDYAPAPGRGGGANWGWNTYEGLHTYPGGTAAPVQPAPPVIEHSHSDGWCSIIGGYVVRDPALPELLGQYVYGDWCKGRVYAATLGPGAASGDRDLGLVVAHMSSFGEDACGRVYVTSVDGPVFRLSSSGECVAPPGSSPGPPPGGSLPVDARAPRLSITRAAAQRALRARRVLLRARCDEPCTITATGAFAVVGRARAAVRKLALHRVRRAVGAGVTARLSLRFSSATRRSVAAALRRGRRVTAAVSVAAVDRAGNRVRRTVRVRVRG